MIKNHQANSNHIPSNYANITHLLEEGLTSDSKASVIVCLPPEQDQCCESCNSMDFDQNCINVKLNRGMNSNNAQR